MKLHIHPDAASVGRAAAAQAAGSLRATIDAQGRARLVAATGNSQLAFLSALTATPLPWDRVELFHLDEYVGLGEEHPASFRRYLRERLVRPTGISKAHLLDGLDAPEAVIAAASAALASAPVDLAFVGIGENGHLAFNDPPADFETTAPYLLVQLDEPCRRQQVGEGWFAALADVPRQAITMSIRQIMKAREIICVVPDARKAEAVRRSLEEPISPQVPASVLRTHAGVTLHLDEASASLLAPHTRALV